MRFYHLILVGVLLTYLIACKEKKKQLSDTEPVEYADFIDFFPEIKLPFQLADTSLEKKTPDSLRIGSKIFSQYIPDSVLKTVFGKGAKPQLFPLGKSVVKDGETYLLVKAVTPAKRAALIMVFNDEKFVTAMPGILLNSNARGNDHAVMNMDSRYTITTLRQKTVADGQVLYNKKVYVYNTAGVFSLILTESNDQDAAESAVINPIDTLPALNKWSGDYLQDKRNLVSFRDGRKAGTLLFFVHFEKDGGACNGELKGDAVLGSGNTARFTENNGTCSIEFVFSGNTVRMKETEGCGSYRDIKCFFEGSYTRKKKPVHKNPRKKK
ncbi:hypothetical protein [Flavihumibacter fluvii]|uniref:hypothetical protein n=1 Tax=Flavihumibacter fluvii TaxID=2838157 RepID=UPI001BDE871F|nr:hypothetical protein [Flavihumibacter fluvii]ULQ53687.1 hypothetical protein KJS93_05040 [Flavihumibacter fluvii]